MSSKEVNVLLVEDNPGDIRLTIEALKDTKVQLKLFVVNDGIEALAFLDGKGKFEFCPRPDLILLDLNLPKLTGIEVLTRIKNDPSLRRIPVTILSTSSARADIEETYDRQANCYMVKPVDLDAFYGLVRNIDNFWLNAAELPLGERP